jgi:hypothetical protein
MRVNILGNTSAKCKGDMLFRTASEQKKTMGADVVTWRLLELPVCFTEPWALSIHKDRR